MRRWSWIVPIVVGLAGGGWFLWTKHGGHPPPAPPFSGVRGRAEKVVYSQEDPATGAVLTVRAATALTVDGKVGKLFRSPLRPELHLTGVEAEWRNGKGVLVLQARAGKGLYDPEGGAVTLEDVAGLRVEDRDVRTKRLALRPDGRVEIPDDYEAFRGEKSLGRGRAYSGPPEAIGRKP